MKRGNLKTIVSLCLAFTVIFSVYSQTSNPLTNSKQVAKKSNELTVCDRTLLKETVTIPLSLLTEELQILKLDDTDAALVKETPVEISDNYLLVKGSGAIPFKLFDKKTGKFLTNIGSFGQGPGEYRNVYDQQLDEKNNRIYLLPWQSKSILVYDLQGKALTSIPLIADAPKGKFKVDTKSSTVIVSILPFTGVNAVVWTQTTDGKLVNSIVPGHLAVAPDFSNEVEAYKTGNEYGFNIFTFAPRADSVYHYNSSQNKLIPVFTLDFKNMEQTIHSYSELPDYYLGQLAEPKQIAENLTTTQNNRFYIVDKKTLKGSFFKLENDFLGNIEIEWPSYTFSGEYYVRNVDPMNLRDELEKTLQSAKKLSPEIQARLKKLKDSITDNDNNYILYAKLKKQ
jgi:hypothetical protein